MASHSPFWYPRVRCMSGEDIMRITRLARAAMVAALLLGSGAAFAHHSPSQYDTAKTTTLTGTVTEFQWMNPHAQIKMTVKDVRGNSEDWTIECSPPNLL